VVGAKKVPGLEYQHFFGRIFYFHVQNLFMNFCCFVFLSLAPFGFPFSIKHVVWLVTGKLLILLDIDTQFLPQGTQVLRLCYMVGMVIWHGM